MGRHKCSGCSLLILISLFSILKISFSNGHVVDPLAELSALNAVRVPSQCINNTASQNRYTSLICWLWDLELSIPDDSFRKGLVSVTIKDMTCTNFQINATNSEYIPGSLDLLRSDPKLNLSIYGFSTVCTGKYESGFASGTLSVLVENFPSEPLYFQTSINSTFIHHGDTDIIKVPSAWNVEECKTNLEVPKDGGIYFSGSFSAKLIGLFSKPISKHVTSTINSQMCPKVKGAIEITLTNLIGKVVKVLENLIFGEINYADDENTSGMYEESHGMEINDDVHVISGGALVVPRNDVQSYSRSLSRSANTHLRSHINDDKVLQWSEMASFEKSISGMSNFVNTHLDEGVFLKFLRRIGWFHNNSASGNCTDCGYLFFGVNGLLRNITKYGQIILQVNNVFNYTIASLGEVSVGIQNATISGMDSFARIEIMPREPNHIIPAIALNNLGVSVNVDLKVIPTKDGIIHGSMLEETFNLLLKAKDLALETMVEILILKEYFLNVTMHDLLMKNYDDIWNSLTRVLLTHPESTISIDAFNIDPSQYSDSLEVSLDTLLNDVIRLILKEYHVLVSRTLQAAFGGPLLTTINRAIEDWIGKRKSECIVTGAMSSWRTSIMLKSSNDFYHFNQSETVQEISDFFSSEKWINRINDFILCVSGFVRDNPLHPHSITRNGISVQIEDITFGGIRIDDVGKFFR